MHIRAGANATIKKKRRNRKVMYPGIKPTINADEINNLDKLIKMKKEIKKKSKNFHLVKSFRIIYIKY